MLVRRRVRSTASLVGSITAILALAAPARAACVNYCDAIATIAVIEPALECLELSANAGTCDCGMSFTVFSNCDNDIETVGFVFDTCWHAEPNTPTIDAYDTNFVHSGFYCSIGHPLTTVGTTSYEYHLAQGGTDHKVTFQIEVTSFDDSHCACSAVGRSAKAGKGALTALGTGALALALNFRRRKHPRKIV